MNFEAETYRWLQDFSRDNGLPGDMGTAIEELCQFYRRMLIEVPTLRREAEAGTKARQEIDEIREEYRRRRAELDDRENRLQLWEQHTVAAEKKGTPYLPIQTVRELLEHGMNADDIRAVHTLATRAGVPVHELAVAMDQFGGAIETAKRMRREMDALTAQRNALAAKYKEEQALAADALAAAVGKARELEARAKQYQEALAATDARIGQVREFSGQVEQVYRVLGMVLQDVVKPVLADGKASRVEHLPLHSLLYLAGAVLTVAEQLYGDRVFDMRTSAENMVPVRIRLSEIPALFAPADAYRAQRDLALRQMELTAAYGENGMEEIEHA